MQHAISLLKTHAEILLSMYAYYPCMLMQLAMLITVRLNKKNQSILYTVVPTNFLAQ